MLEAAELSSSFCKLVSAIVFGSTRLIPEIYSPERRVRHCDSRRVLAANRGLSSTFAINEGDRVLQMLDIGCLSREFRHQVAHGVAEQSQSKLAR